MNITINSNNIVNHPSLNFYKKKGFQFKDPWDITTNFEKIIADYSGSKYAIGLNSCSSAIFLCLKYIENKNKNRLNRNVIIPEKTYCSVPMQIIHAGFKPVYKKINWEGLYELKPFKIIDGATRFTENQYIKGSLHCLSFHHRKILKIGVGGMILTDDKNFIKWAKPRIYDGRSTRRLYKKHKNFVLSYHFYLPPELSLIGLQKFKKLKKKNFDCGGSAKYMSLKGKILV